MKNREYRESACCETSFPNENNVINWRYVPEGCENQHFSQNKSSKDKVVLINK